MTAASSRPGARRTFRIATHGLGALVLVSFCCALACAVVAYITYVADHADGARRLTDAVFGKNRGPRTDGGATIFSCAWGVLGSVAGSALVVMMWITGVSSSRLRRKMIAIFARRSVPLTLLAVTGIVCGAGIPVMNAMATGGDLQSRGSLLILTVFAGGSSVALGVILGALTMVVLTVGFLARILAGLVHAAFGSTRPAPAHLSAGTGVPWPIRAAAALMPAEYGGRWRDDFAEALFDYAPDRHAVLRRDFLLHAPATIAWAWTAILQRHLLGAGHSRGRHE